VEKNRRFAEHVACLDKFCETLAEQRDVEVIDGLGGAGPDSDEGCGIVQRSDGDGIALALNLRSEEAHAAGHLFYATDLADKGALEGVYIGVELRSRGTG
jgi:hypothetical protein